MFKFKDGTKVAGDWLHASGRARKLANVQVTRAEYAVPSVVVAKARKMKDTWCLASNRSDSASMIVSLYGRRFTIEETFRDTKNIHFGMGLIATHIGSLYR